MHMGPSRKKIIITGAAGYIAGHLIEHFQQKNFDLLLIDKEKINEKGNAQTLKLDICDRQAVFDALDAFEPDAIIDLAALTVVSDELSIQNYHMNFALPSILEDYYRSKRKTPRIVFTSTQYVIGPSYDWRIKTNYRPHTTYGHSKVLYENSILHASEVLRDFIIIRPTNVWGGKHPKYSSLWEPLLRKGLIFIPKYNPIKSYCHITTIIELISAALEIEINAKEFSERIIYATDEPITQKLWVEIQCNAFKEAGLNAKFWSVPLPILKLIALTLTALKKIHVIRNNPLPFSRLQSMKGSYLVNLDRPAELPKPKNASEIYRECLDDFKGRYNAK